jgi:hypothetical protein
VQGSGEPTTEPTKHSWTYPQAVCRLGRCQSPIADYVTTSKRNTESSPVNDTVVVRNQASRPSFLFSHSLKTKVKGGLYKRKKSRAHWGRFHKEKKERKRTESKRLHFSRVHLSCVWMCSLLVSHSRKTQAKDGLYKRNKPIAHWGRFQKKREGGKKNQRKQHCTSRIFIFSPSQCEGHRDTETYLYSWTSSKYFSEYWICGMFSKLQCNGCTQARILRVTRRLLESLLHPFYLKKKNLALEIREREESKRHTQRQQKQQYQQHMNARAEERRSARATG